jgi:hypothetical protein
MSTRRERRAQSAVKDSEERELERSRRFRILGVGILGSVLFGIGLVVLWRSLPDANRTTASEKSVAATTETQKDGKSLEELSKDLADKAYKQRSAKEWIWAQEGDFEKIIDQFRNSNLTSTARREERARLLDFVARNARPRKDWNGRTSDTTLGLFFNFLSEVLSKEEYRGGIQLAATRALASWGKAVPEYSVRAEKELLKFHAFDTRPGPRGEVYTLLCGMGSTDGLRLAVAASASSDPSMVRMALYALATVLNHEKLGQPAKRALRQAAMRVDRNRALAVKLLAQSGDRSIASSAPILLKDGSSPSEVEAGAYLVGKFQLKQYREAVIKRLPELDSMTRATVEKNIEGL